METLYLFPKPVNFVYPQDGSLHLCRFPRIKNRAFCLKPLERGVKADYNLIPLINTDAESSKLHSINSMTRCNLSEECKV